MKLNRAASLIAAFVLLCGGLVGPAVRASAAGQLTLNKPALELSLGESELISAEGGGNVAFYSGDESVAMVSDNGVVKGVGVGDTEVTAERGGAACTIPVHVIPQERDFDDNILISVFWPPTAEYMNGGEGDERWDEQFKLLSDAHIDYLCNVTGRDRQQNIGSVPRQENTKETNLKMAAYAYKYGMRVSVADERFSGFLQMSAAEIQGLIDEYRNVPGVGGYYILDEPFDPMPYAFVHEAIKLADEAGYTHLNFQPIHAYGRPVGTLDSAADERYRAVLRSWLQAGEDCGFPQDYLMFDFYPFTGTEGGMARDIYFANLAAVREVGLEYGVKTANYLQSVSSVLQSNGALSFRSTTPSEIRYEAMLSLAYGCKQLSYFTWFLPTNRNGETFSKSIVDENGAADPYYYGPVTDLNAEIHALGKTLIGLDAEEVYLNGTQWGWQEGIPENFVLQPTDSKNYTVSRLTDRETARDYLMVVNNDYAAPLTTEVKLDGFTFLRRISPENGEAVTEYLAADGTLSLTLDAGDGALFSLPAGGETAEPAPEDPSIEEPASPSEGEKESGCGSVIGTCAIVLLLAAAFCIRKNHKNSEGNR